MRDLAIMENDTLEMLHQAMDFVDERIIAAAETSREIFYEVFGRTSRLDALLDLWIEYGVDFSGINVVPSSRISGNDGAYVPATDTIYLSSGLLLNPAATERLSDVLMEEIGHRIDAQVNDADTPGDEGETLVVRLRGEPWVDLEEDTVLADGGGGVLNLIEHATSVSDSGGYEGSSKDIKLDSLNGGEISYYYQHYTIPDRFIIRYDGGTLLDTGFTGGSVSGTIPLPAGTSDTLEVRMVTDDQGTAWNYGVTVTLAECESARPWLFTPLGDEEFVHNTEKDVCEAVTNITVGRNDGADPLFKTVGSPKVEFTPKQLTLSGATILSGIGGVNGSLFYADKLDLNLFTGKAALTGVQPGTLKLASLDVEIQDMHVLSNRMAFNATFKLPDEASGAFIDLRTLAPMGLQISSGGAYAIAGFVLDPPLPYTFKMLDVVKTTISNMKLAYKPSEDAFQIQGKLVLENANWGPGSEGLKSVEADLTGTNQLRINTDGDIDIVGVLKATGEQKIGKFKLKELTFSIDTIAGTIGGSSTLETPFGVKFGEGIEAKVEIGFSYRDFELDKALVALDNINKPIPAYPLFFFQSANGGLKDMIDGDAKPTTLQLGAGVTLGPQIAGTSLAKGQLTGEFNEQSAKLTGTIDFLRTTIKLPKFPWDDSQETVGPYSLIKYAGSTILDWSKGQMALDGSFTFADNFVNATGKTSIDTSFNFALGGGATLNIPSFVPKLGGIKIAGGNFQTAFTNDGDLSNDFIAGWGQYRINTIIKTFDITLGLRIAFDGSLTRIGAGNIPKTSSWFVEGGQDYVMLTADWENDSASARVYVTKPDGTIVQEADFATHGIAIVNEFSSLTSRTIIIDSPTGGTWDLELVDTTGLGGVDYEASGAETGPGFSFTSGPVPLTGDQIQYNFLASLDVPSANVSFYYDDDLSELDGAFAGQASIGDGSGSFVWNTTGVAPGGYYLYAIVDDGSGPLTTVQLNQSVNAGTAVDLSAVMTSDISLPDAGDTLQYTIRVTNLAGSGTAKNVTALVDLPSNAAFSTSSLAGTSTNLADLEFSLGDIAAGETSAFTIDVELDANAPVSDQIAAGVFVKTDSYDSDLTNDSAGLQVTVQPEPDTGSGDLRVLSTLASGQVVTAGEAFSYIVVIKNVGPGTAEGVKLTETIQNAKDVNIDKTFTKSGNVYTVELGDLEEGHSTTVVVSGTAVAAGIIEAISSVFGEGYDGNISDNEDINQQSVKGPDPDPADLSVTASAGSPDSQGRVILDISITNSGPGIASGVKLDVDFPGGMVVDSHSVLQGTFDAATGEWDVGNMRDSLTRQLSLTLSGTTAGDVIAEIIEVGEADPDSTPADGQGDDYATAYVSFGTQDIIGTNGPDTLEGNQFDNRIEALGGDDLIEGKGGADFLYGGPGYDTAAYTGSAWGYSVTIADGEIIVEDRTAARDGTDKLYDVEKLTFDSGTGFINLPVFTGVAGVTATELSTFVEMYIAYFNRAPDALGLFYWGTRLHDGMTLEEIAESFFVQPETQATYAAVFDDQGNLIDTGAFVTAVYNNVLGRGPDQLGFNYWVNELDNNPSITTAIFMLAVINGAKAASGDPQDVAYITNKSDLGAYFSVIKGMSDVDNAKSALALFDGSAASINTTKAAIDTYYADALDPIDGEFLVNLVGVLDDPFA